MGDDGQEPLGFFVGEIIKIFVHTEFDLQSDN
jgi:hypothetical protein